MMESVLLFLFVCLGYTGSERILAVLPFSGKSHFFVFEPLLSELAKRGHDLTVISHFPMKTVTDHYTDIKISTSSFQDEMPPLSELVKMDLSLPSIMPDVNKMGSSYESIYKDKSVQELLNSSAKFDLVICELFISDMFITLADKYKSPLVMMSSSEIIPWGADRFMVPDNPSYIQNLFYSRSGKMSFYERLVNTVELLYAKFYYSFIITSNDDGVSRRYLGDVPHVSETMKRASLLLVNSHFSVNRPRPLPPQVVEIGGIHIQPAKALPQDIEKFLNEAQNGVVYFSLGSITNASTMSEEARIAFCNVFSRLQQRVLWKWEQDKMPGKPDNVKIVKWMPQRDILAHPNVRLFMSHGGLLGTMEAVYNGVPMIGIPLFGDQRHNIGNLEDIGYAMRLELMSISEESVAYAVNTVLNDPKFTKTAKRISQIFRDRPSSALDTAVYWTEYVLKHGGSHLQTAAVNLPWYQYFLLDVIAVLVSVLLIVIFVFIYVVKVLLKKVGLKQKIKVS